MKAPLILALLSTATALSAVPPEPRFQAVTIDDQIQIGYGLAIADVDGDQKPDILCADKKQIVWYRNPGGAAAAEAAQWRKYVMAENLTAKDDVCIAAEDIDGDGKAEVAVGAEWNPGDTVNSGAVFYLIAPADRTQPWTPVRFPEVEPTTHRMRWIKVGSDGDEAAKGKSPVRWGLLVQPLHGRGNKNGEGASVRVLLYHPPTPLNDPKGEWKSELVDESLHMSHNFSRLSLVGSNSFGTPDGLLLGGKEGLVSLRRMKGQWQRTEPPMSGEKPSGVGEVRLGSLVTGTQFIATVEPMHGNVLAVYLPQKAEAGVIPLARQVLTDKLMEGHALACGNVLGGFPNVTASDQIVVGWRGKAGQADSTIGVAVWTPLDARGEKWRETIVDRDGMACEDLQLADLDGDGRLDIIAAGRATKNVRIYFNRTETAAK